MSLLCCLNHLNSASSTSPRSGFRYRFRYRFTLNPFCSNALIIFVLFFQIVWFVEFTRPNSRHTSAFLLTFSIYLITFSFKAKNLPLFVTVTILPRNQSPVNCRSRNVEGNVTHIANYCQQCHFPDLQFTSIMQPDSTESSSSQGGGDNINLKIVKFW